VATILLIDDDADHLDVAAYGLRCEGFTVRQRPSPEPISHPFSERGCAPHLRITGAPEQLFRGAFLSAGARAIVRRRSG
jgi:hypothetical protein